MLSCVTVSLALQSCDKDNDEVNSDGGKPQWVLVMCSAHYSIDLSDDNDRGNISADWDIEFSYNSEGKVKSDTDEDWVYSYDGDNITTDDGYVFKLGNNGYITSFKTDDKVGQAEYNSNGNIIKFMDGDDWIVDLEWGNGLLNRFSVKYADRLETKSLEYYNNEMINADCINALNALVICWNGFDGYWGLGMSGFWGKMPAKPIKKLTSKTANSYVEPDYTVYSYEDIDSNGCPGTLVMETPRYTHE